MLVNNILPLALPLLLATPALAESWQDILEDFYGECGAKCAMANFRDQAKCGDPGSESTTRCYCEKFPSIVIGEGDFGPCVNKCGVDATTLDYVQWSKDVDELCDGDFAGDSEVEHESVTSTATSSAGSASETETETATEADEPTPTPTGSEDEEESATESSVGDESSTPTPTPDAANTVASSSQIVLLVGALAFLGFTL
ncbi:hypothetical protein BJX64DRAFT_295000 [Aspergillus heterothallicus]